MKLLTLTQPWATLVAIGAKRIETRSWSTSYRGRIAIHAAVGLGPVGDVPGLWRQCSAEPFRSALHQHVNYPDDLPRGVIVAVAELTDCCPTFQSLAGGVFVRNGSSELVTEQERAFGDYSPGRYAWLLSDVRPLPTPLMYRGSQGLRPLPAEVVALIEAQL